MPGGLLQLAGYGNQDIYFTGSPVISYFKVVYRRYTNFYINTEELLNNEIFNTITNTTRKDILQNNNNKSDELTTNVSEQIIIFNIPKNGDLLSKYNIKFNISNNYNELLKFYDNLNNTIKNYCIKKMTFLFFH